MLCPQLQHASSFVKLSTIKKLIRSIDITYDFQLFLSLFSIPECIGELGVGPTHVLTILFRILEEPGVVSFGVDDLALTLLLEVIKVLGDAQDLLLVELYLFSGS